MVSALSEGMSLRATARITGVARMTIEKLLRDLGAVCERYQDETLRNLPCRRVECDEIWSFIYAKAQHVPTAKNPPPEAGDVWTWVGMDAESKLVLSWRIGQRDGATAFEFMDDLARRLRRRVQLTTDGLRLYLEAVEQTFGADVDYAMLQKLYGRSDEPERRYSPPRCTGIDTRVVMGDPDPDLISTSYIERQNLTMRMHLRRFTRLTNAFSKSLHMHAAAVAVHYMVYNFVKIHGTLRVSPAMAAGVTDHLWEIEDLVMLLEQAEAEEMARRRRARAEGQGD